MSKVKVRNPKTDGDDFGEYEPYEDEMGRRILEIDEHKFLIIADGQYALFTIKQADGGPTPKVLSGQYTTMAKATHAIKVYLANQKVN